MKQLWTAFFPLLMLVAACGQPEVKIVSVDPTTTSFTDINQSTHVKAKGLELNGSEIPNTPITFRTSNSSIAKVTTAGVITPVASGNATVTATSLNGKEAQTFIKICLPKNIVCIPNNTLALRVGTAAPLKCHLIDCKDNKIDGSSIDFINIDKEAVFKDGKDTFVGKKVGQTSITAKGGGLEKKINITIAEQIFSPGMAPRKGGHYGGGSNGGVVDKNKNPYGEKGQGQFDHILGNIKF